jgi:predicted helicase
MLAQHMITKPIFDALFSGFEFTKINPVSITLEKVLKSLTGHLESNKKLEVFYEQISLRIVGIDNNESRQKLITELYERFFKNAFPAMAQKLGIVYTPVEIVDFIIASVEEVLRSEFSTSLSNKGVQVLDPFSGTGTFLVRLLQSGIISCEDLEYKFNHELHANEIVLLAYYIGAINIESTFAEINGKYVPFEGNVLADTFQMFEDDDKLDSEVFISNNKRAEIQKSKEIQVIIGNPPFSIGQRNQDDNNQNVSYPSLDSKIQKSYAQQSSATSKRSNYDSYIRAFRWASDRIDKDGVICFVSNGSFIDSGSLDGFRKSIEREFSTCYIFNLRGNQRTSGELSRREGGKIFGSGSRVSIAVTLLVKNTKNKKFELKYHDIGDYLTREKKLELIKNFRSIKNIPWENLETDKYGDWINKRSSDFDELQKLRIQIRFLQHTH